jgi:hypothetical protein
MSELYFGRPPPKKKSLVQTLVKATNNLPYNAVNFELIMGKIKVKTNFYLKNFIFWDIMPCSLVLYPRRQNFSEPLL